MQTGYIKLWRRLQISKFWLSEKFTRGQAWVDLLMLANHKNGGFRIRGIWVDIKRGQVGYSEDSLAVRWRWSRGKVRRFLNELETVQQIVQQKNNILSIITIINYDIYQDNSTADSTTNSTADGQQTDTNNNDKNDKNNIYVPFDQIGQLFNTVFDGLPKIKLWTKKRKQVFKARWLSGIESKAGKKIDTIEFWEGYFNYIKTSDFLMGKNGGWQVNFDWIIKEGNMIKIIEGNFHR